MDEPTPAELLRRLDEVSRQLLDLTTELRYVNRSAAETYVRKDVFSEARIADAEKHREQERDIDALKESRAGDAAFRRQVLLGLGVALIGILGTAAGLLTAVLTR